MATLVSLCIFFVFVLSTYSVTGDLAIKSALRDVRKCLGDNIEPCLVDRVIENLLDVAQLTDIKTQFQNGERSQEQSIEELLVKKLAIESGISNEELKTISTGRTRTFNKAWKYLVPFLIGVMLKLAAFIPLVFSVLIILAKNALISGNLALLITGLNIALKYWYPKWSAHSYSPLYEQFGHMGLDNHGHFHGFNHGLGYQQSLNQHSLSSLNQNGHQQDDLQEQHHFGNPHEGQYKTRRIFLTP